MKSRLWHWGNCCVGEPVHEMWLVYILLTLYEVLITWVWTQERVEVFCQMKPGSEHCPCGCTNDTMHYDCWIVGTNHVAHGCKWWLVLLADNATLALRSNRKKSIKDRVMILAIDLEVSHCPLSGWLSISQLDGCLAWWRPSPSYRAWPSS